MISNFSHVSDDDEEYRRLTLHVDEDVCGTVISCPLQQSKSSTAVLQSRALQYVCIEFLAFHRTQIIYVIGRGSQIMNHRLKIVYQGS